MNSVGTGVRIYPAIPQQSRLNGCKRTWYAALYLSKVSDGGASSSGQLVCIRAMVMDRFLKVNAAFRALLEKASNLAAMMFIWLG